MPEKSGLDILEFTAAAAWQRWLQAHHASSPGLWLKIPKKDSGLAGPTYAQALDEALCFGWIDGQKAALDARSWLQRFTPRRPGSPWSKINTGHAERLIRSGRMRPAGMRQVEAAKSDGRWKNAYQGQARAGIPADFLQAVARVPRARAFLESLNRANRYAITYRLQSAKTPETRRKRFQKFLEMMEKGEKFHP